MKAVRKVDEWVAKEVWVLYVCGSTGESGGVFPGGLAWGHKMQKPLLWNKSQYIFLYFIKLIAILQLSPLKYIRAIEFVSLFHFFFFIIRLITWFLKFCFRILKNIDNFFWEEFLFSKLS